MAGRGVFCRLPRPPAPPLDSAWAGLVFTVRPNSLSDPPEGWPPNANATRGDSCEGLGRRGRAKYKQLREGGSSSGAAADVIQVATAQRNRAAAEASVPVHALLRLECEEVAASLVAKLLALVAGAMAKAPRR